ncbi:protein phosphatase CheZ [Aliivibrio fischeri]|uniref:Protein phosphatase CheZ n=2 Tax=Aliivibrio fischeri TaxID=668 RepID=Q5E3R9_ALIF1|nr:protein phosphatase CheZ [Aliivibrio fischeri]AAW86327.1 chemotaxis regulator CheZ, protein phosphatase for CheY [Aliivibrio fischeri ES114]KLU79381.1 protein phosphatase [Aliivibrio fischeri]MBP3142492.1 protein phosphatase CheZ [Aliivibrio fischeri]MBP3156883.1 protein phosphatase CheZ [Aliivibrio fischeri]MCE7535175.1 protein phosphatase CheZ [Aliivibrio fischeri]
MISLTDAKELVALLEDGKQEEANQLVASLAMPSEQPMLKEIGSLTRDLHESLKNFKLDHRVVAIANDEIPDARDRLQYVIDKTEMAANKTMDAVDRSLPIADELHEGLLQVRPQWNSLMKGRIELAQFKTLCHNIDGLLTQVEGNSSELRNELTTILMAQDFQDLTGQIIKRVITLVQEVEDRLVDILTLFKVEERLDAADQSKKPAVAEGPIINPHEREDAVASQDDVDDLLASLGF